MNFSCSLSLRFGTQQKQLGLKWAHTVRWRSNFLWHIILLSWSLTAKSENDQRVGQQLCEVAATPQGTCTGSSKSSLGIDVGEHDYKPKYITIGEKEHILAALRKSRRSEDRDQVFLSNGPRPWGARGDFVYIWGTTALKLDEKRRCVGDYL